MHSITESKENINHQHLLFKKANYILLTTSLLLIISGLVTMSLDKQPYGYGLPGITIGPLVLMAGFILTFIAIFYTDERSRLNRGKKDSLVNIIGWLIFSISLAIYTYTVEPTSSFWDCGEFIAAAYKLQIPHPPGAPLFLLIGRIFSLFAPDKEWIAFSVNMVSVVASAFTVLILYATIILLIKKLNKIITVNSNTEALYISGPAAIGSLGFAFTDSFWFNATEAEVYALSCLFTALVFWAMLKWESQHHEKGSSKWLLFIAYLIGLSTGVHLLNLLTLPALAIIFYFRKYTFTWKGALVALIIGMTSIVLVTDGIIVGLPSLAGHIEVFFVNNLGLPFNSGIVFFCATVVATMVWMLHYAIKKRKGILHTLVLCFLLILVGYMSYLLVMIRSSYNPPLDENDPGDVMSLILYLKRDQYGSRPLLKGPDFTATYPEKVNKISPRYRQDKPTNKYIIYDYDYEYIYNARRLAILPRMYSNDARHAEAYLNWSGLKEGKRPEFSDHLSFLFSYQLGHQYFRYFMWNFAGRESDDQNAGWLMPWEWFSEDLPETLRNNKARNNYFLLPLLLGITGMIYHFRSSSKDAIVVLLLFLFSGVAIVIYLNQPPIEPRERDYTHVGSFYAFSIWMGFGVIGLYHFLSRVFKNKILSTVLCSLLAMLVPILLLAENWNDHNRRGRYFAPETAKNVLQGCEEQAILFTGADNDTFPLWYVQEAEEFRTDVRICITSLLNMDWYISAMKQKGNASEPLPVSLEYKDYIRGKNDHIYPLENPRLSQGIDLSAYLELIKKSDPLVKQTREDQQELTILPSKNLFLKVDQNIAEKILPSHLHTFAVNKINIQIPEGLSKSALIVLDIIATNQWKRPIYFNHTTIHEFPFLKPYLQNEGFLYRLMPARISNQEGWLDTEKMYKNLMHKSSWKGLNEKVYTDPAAGPFVAQTRMAFYTLAAALYNEGKKELSEVVLRKCLNIIPDTVFPYDHTLLHYSDLLFKLDNEKRALEICETLLQRSIEFLKYGDKRKSFVNKEYHLYVLYECINLLKKSGRNEKAVAMEKEFKKHYSE